MSMLRVLRNRPRSRAGYTNLTGKIYLTIKTLSRKENDPVDSYLHVGTGFERVRISEGIKAVARDMGRIGIRQLAQSRWSDIVGSGEYMQMTMVGDLPVIPGSSVKGNVRSRMELSFIPTNVAVRSCYSVAGAGRRSWRHSRIWGQRVNEDRGRPCVYDERRDGVVCLLCDVFGTQSLAGLVDFSDMIGRDVKLEPINAEFGVKILAAPPGSSFSGEIVFRNLSESELGLILYSGMRVGEDGVGRPVLLGRFKYRGRLADKVFGRIKYQPNSITLSKLSNPLPSLSPGETASATTLRQVIKPLISSAKKEFGAELNLVDEVAALGRA